MSISDEHLYAVCKLGKMADTCKYLSVTGDGFQCMKLSPSIKLYIDGRTDMHAKGDNCDGWIPATETNEDKDEASTD